jgi:hypothetical protein
MARKIPSSRPTSRKPANKRPKFLIIAVCEGKNTEPTYLKSFARHYGNGLVEVETVAPAGAPVTIVQTAVVRKKARDGRKKADSFDKLFEVWAVFDRDEHPNIPQALDLANAHNVQIAISNPCIEIWPLLHFTNHQAPIHRHKLQQELAKYMPSYQPNGSKIIDFEAIKDRFTEARTRAERQLAGHEATGDPNGNPSTTLYRLLDKIIQNGIVPSSGYGHKTT